MSLTREQCGEYLTNGNVRAFLRVIREGESGQDDSAYRIINGGAHFDAPPWAHPWHGIPTTKGAKASGAYQFLGTTWGRIADAWGLGGDEFTPGNQDAGAVYLIDGRGALAAVLAGDLVKACSLLRDEWIALPQMGLQRLQRVFLQYGGTLTPGAEVSQAPPPAPKPQQPAPQPLPEATMPLPILGLIAAFGPIIAELIPQLATIFKPKGEVAQRNVALAQTAFDTITRAAAATNVQEAVEKMQADPVVREAVTQAVVVQPEIMASLQIGPGGVDGARKQMEALIAPQPDDKWYSLIVRTLFNPILLVSAGLVPLIYIILLNLVPQFEKLSADAVAGMLNTIIGLVLGGVCGFWLGQVYSQNQSRKQGGDGTGPAS